MSNVKKMQVPFAQVPNELLYCETLSLKAKGLWAYMQAKPEDWNFASDRITKETRESASAILSAMKELIELGWLSKVKLTSGRIEYTLHEKPDRENPIQAKSLSGKTECISNKEINKERDISNKEIIYNQEEIKDTRGADINAVITYFYKAMAPAVLGRAYKMTPTRNAAGALLDSYTPGEIRENIDRNKAMPEGFNKCYTLIQFSEKFEAIRNYKSISNQPKYIDLDEK